MNTLPTAAKIAAIPAVAVGLLSMKYVIGHTLNVMILIAVITGIIAVASSAKAKRKPAPAVPVERSAEDIVSAWTPPPAGLPRATAGDPIDAAYLRLVTEARSK